VKFYVAVAYNDPTHLTAIARAAEEAGFGGVVLSDHVVYPGHLATPYPYTENGQPRWRAETPWPDPFVAVGAMAAVTARLRFLVSVFVLPLRHPVLAAKTIATAAVMSGGRLTLGVGAGWMREEFELVGQPFAGRGRRLTEQVEVMRTLWRGGMVEHHGEHYDFGPLQMSPVPPEPIPIYGGGASEAALRRVAAHFDGWASEIQSFDEVEEIRRRLQAYRSQTERAGQPIGLCVALRHGFDLDGYRRAAALGISELITVPWLFYAADPSSCMEKCDGIRRFGDEVIARLEATKDSD
jgi:probable F420-dependent oxidoreductase